MHHLDIAILNAFKKVEGKELTTSEIVRLIFPDDANTFDVDGADILFVGGEKKVRGKIRHKKSLLHKRLLYHLNKLVKNNILKLSGIEEFGEKRFALSGDSGEIILEDNTKTIVINNNLKPLTPIDGYEDKKIIKKLDPNNWINKLDSIVLDATKFSDLDKLYNAVYDLFNEVSDCIAILNFEKLIQNKDDTFLSTFIKNLSNDTKDYNKRIGFIINCENIYDKARMKNFIRLFSSDSNNSLQIFFDVTISAIKQNNTLFSYIIETFSQKKIKINIKNKELCKSPVFFGKAGVYSFDEKEWKLYKKEFADKTIGVSCSSSTLMVDIQEFFNNYKNAHEFREFMLKANKALLIANVNKRKTAHHCLRSIHKLNKPYSREFFFFERNYIRFWNYNFKLFEKNSFLLDIFRTIKEESESFFFTEETIYKSCGIPIRFKIAFSSAFRKSDLTMTQRSYVKRTVHNIKYFDSVDSINYLKTREKLSKIFNGIDRVRFFRVTVDNPKEVINEFNYILKNLHIPFFTYDFAKIKGNAKLTSFFADENKKNKTKLK
jgi:hypothetical protein